MLGKVQGVWADPARLGRLLDARIIQLAVIDGSSAATAQPSGRTDALHELFAHNYRLLRRPD